MQLTNAKHGLRLAIWLTDEFSGGELVRFGPEASVSIEGFDALSASYAPANWVSGVTSGALYAFRTLRIPRQRVVVTEFAGHLEASDMDAVAAAAALAVTTLANKELPGLSPEGWTSQVQVSERSASEATQQDDMVERARRQRRWQRRRAWRERR